MRPCHVCGHDLEDPYADARPYRPECSVCGKATHPWCTKGNRCEPCYQAARCPCGADEASQCRRPGCSAAWAETVEQRQRASYRRDLPALIAEIKDESSRIGLTAAFDVCETAAHYRAVFDSAIKKRADERAAEAEERKRKQDEAPPWLRFRPRQERTEPLFRSSQRRAGRRR
jgi:hypothetical protein